MEEDKGSELDDDEQDEVMRLQNDITKDKYAQKKLELMMKMNEARKLNNKAVVEETERMTDPLYEKRRNKEEYQNDKRSLQAQLQEKGLAKDKTYIYDTAN